MVMRFSAVVALPMCRPLVPAKLRNVLLKRILHRALCALAVSAASLLSPGCSQGDGEGRVHGVLNVDDCWQGRFELKPDFFAGVPYRDTLQIRLQNGGDFANFSDGVSILVDDLKRLRPAAGTTDGGAAIAGDLGATLPVSLPPEVTPPGVPVVSTPNAPYVHLTLFLQKTCRTQNAALYAVDQVVLPTDGSCDVPSDNDRDPYSACGVSSAGDAKTGRSVILFNRIFDGKPDESDANERLSEGCFDVYLADPRDVALPQPPPCRGHLRGNFRFFFERGRPAQPFP